MRHGKFIARLHSCAAALLLALVALTPAAALAEEETAAGGPYIVIREDAQYGLMNTAGQVVAEPSYDRIDTSLALSSPNTGWLKVAQRQVNEDNQVLYNYALMDEKTLEILTPFQYTDIEPLCPGFALVSVNRQAAENEVEAYAQRNWGIVRVSDGKEILPIQEGGSCGLLACVDGAYYFTWWDGAVNHVLNEEGEEILSLEGTVDLCDAEGRSSYYQGFYTTFGTVQWQDAEDFEGYIIRISTNTDIENNRIEEAYDFQGNPVPEMVGRELIYGSPTANACTQVYRDGMVALGNEEGEPLTDFIYDDIVIETENDAVYITAWRENVTDILDSEGNVLLTIPEKVFRNVNGDYTTLAWSDGTSFSLYTPEGVKVDLPPCDDAERVGDDRYVIMDYNTGINSLVNLQGEILIEEMTSFPQIDSEGGLIAQVPLGGRSFYGLFNLDGEPILNPIYNYMECVGEDLYFVYQGWYEGYIDRTGKWIYQSSRYDTLG